MYVYESLTTNEIAQRLVLDSYAGWSTSAARELALYFEDLAESIGEPIELDLVAIRCDFSELSAQELIDEAICQGFEDYDPENQIESEERAAEFMRDRTTVIDCSSSYVLRDF